MSEHTNHEFPRRFAPADCDLGDWASLEPLFQALLERPLDDGDGLEAWLLDQSELASCLAEERARRYIAMTCNTEDAELERRFMHFIEEIEPKCKPLWRRMNEKYLDSPARQQLPRERYDVLDRCVEAEVRIYRDENVPLQTEAQKSSQKYQKLCGAMTVEFDGKEQTLPQMAKYLEETDRARREEAWRLVSQRRLQDRDVMDDIFDDLIQLRHQMARNADYDNFIGYAFAAFKRFDYTPEDCFAFHEAVERRVVPLTRRLSEERRIAMKLERLRPWDGAVDPLGRPPLRPFETAEQLCDGVERIMRKLDDELTEQFVSLRANGDLDLDSRKGKAPGGYQYTLEEVRRPFIFMNSAGLQRDVITLLHEAGHAFHALAARQEPLIDYRSSPIEFAEVASMSMELFGAAHFEEFYSPDEADRARRQHLERVIDILPWVAQIDAFQHWIYANPNHSRDQRTGKWLELEERFGAGYDWSGLDEARAASWQRQLHLYCHAFYYIEYGIAQLGALQLWKRFKEDRSSAVAGYRAALALGGAKPLPQLFEAAGAPFDFSEAAIDSLMDTVEEELERLPL